MPHSVTDPELKHQRVYPSKSQWLSLSICCEVRPNGKKDKDLVNIRNNLIYGWHFQALCLFIPCQLFFFHQWTRLQGSNFLLCFITILSCPFMKTFQDPGVGRQSNLASSSITLPTSVGVLSPLIEMVSVWIADQAATWYGVWRWRRSWCRVPTQYVWCRVKRLSSYLSGSLQATITSTSLGLLMIEDYREKFFLSFLLDFLET